MNGWLTALLGRQKFYLWSLGIFTVASFLCGTAHTVVELVIWRVIQGIGGGALQPTAQAILFESYPADKRGQAMAIFGVGAMVGPAIGPTLGGWIVDNFSWPLIFYINIPIGIVAFMMTLAYIRDPSYIKKPTRGIDILGLSAMATGIAALQYVLERGQREDWFSSSSICILTVVSVATLTFFVVRELRDPQPFVDLSVFGSRSFTAGSIIGVVSGFGLYGSKSDFTAVLPKRARLQRLANGPGALTWGDRDRAQHADRGTANEHHRRTHLDRGRARNVRGRRLGDGRPHPEAPATGTSFGRAYCKASPSAFSSYH